MAYNSTALARKYFEAMKSITMRITAKLDDIHKKHHITECTEDTIHILQQNHNCAINPFSDEVISNINAVVTLALKG